MIPVEAIWTWLARGDTWGTAFESFAIIWSCYWWNYTLAHSAHSLAGAPAAVPSQKKSRSGSFSGFGHWPRGQPELVHGSPGPSGPDRKYF